MSSSDDETIFITQSTFQPDILDLNNSPNFEVNNPVFSDISDDELVSATQAAEEHYVYERFAEPMKAMDLQELIKKGLSKSTEIKSKWAIGLFKKWQTDRKVKLASDNAHSATNVDDMDISVMDDQILDEALSYFVAEVRNKARGDYKPNTLYEIVVAIQYHLRQSGRTINMLEDKSFDGMRRVLDAKMKELSSRGMGIERKKAEVISEEQEEELWKKNILGTDTPQKLLDSMVYQLGLNFALRAGQEHRNLRVGNLGQITIHTDNEGNKYLQYHEDVSKTNAGGLQHRRIEAKVTRAYENKRATDRCPVRMFEKFISLRPNECKTEALYLRPLNNPTSTCWYADIPVGVHLLQKTIAKLCESGGFVGHYTNHSLRATAATRLYEAGVDEQLITEKTGHRSTAVRSYKRTGEKQLRRVSDILQSKGSSPKKIKGLSPKKGDRARELRIDSGDMSINIKF